MQLMDQFKTLTCPECNMQLSPVQRPEGLLWVCSNCRGAATSLGVLRKAGPSAALSKLWREARTMGARAQGRCPSCKNHLTAIPAARKLPIEFCKRCFLVWVESEAIDRFKLLPTESRVDAEHTDAEIFFS